MPDRELPETVALKEAVWAFHQGWVSAVRVNGAQYVFERTEGVDRALRPESVCLGCMDERILVKSVGVAGSGILWGANQTAEAVKRNGITEITSHSYCAAANLYAEQRYGNPALGEQCAIDFAQEVAAKSGAHYAGHLTPEQFGNPADTHITGIVYYTGIPFDLEVTELPAGFLVTKLKDDPTGALKDVALAVKIAQSEHGFGRRFCKDAPVMLIGIATSNSEKETMTRELESVQGQFGTEFVALDTVVLPNYNS